jgi:hypothetical protein
MFDTIMSFLLFIEQDLESSMDPLDRMTTKEVVGILAEVYQKSDYATAAMSRIQQAAETVSHCSHPLCPAVTYELKPDDYVGFVYI